jgi:hypothetical protein
MLLAVSAVDMLDDLFAPVMLEIDIDIRRLVAVHRHEPIKEQRALLRINFGYLEAVADDRIGGRAPPWHRIQLISGMHDDPTDRQEVGSYCFP